MHIKAGAVATLVVRASFTAMEASKIVHPRMSFAEHLNDGVKS